MSPVHETITNQFLIKFPLKWAIDTLIEPFGKKVINFFHLWDRFFLLCSVVKIISNFNSCECSCEYNLTYDSSRKKLTWVYSRDFNKSHLIAEKSFQARTADNRYKGAIVRLLISTSTYSTNDIEKYTLHC